jgi:hypothetical protein
MDMRKECPFHKVKWKLSLAIGQEEEGRMVEDVVRLLLLAGANPAILDKCGQTAYELAVILNHEALVYVLSPLKEETDTYSSLLDQWYSIRRTKAEEIVQSISTNVEGADAYTVLQTAIGLRDETLFHALLKPGVDPTATGPEALTPAHTIAYCKLPRAICSFGFTSDFFSKRIDAIRMETL